MDFTSWFFGNNYFMALARGWVKIKGKKYKMHLKKKNLTEDGRAHAIFDKWIPRKKERKKLCKYKVRTYGKIRYLFKTTLDYIDDGKTLNFKI